MFIIYSGKDQEDSEEPNCDGDPGGGVLTGAHPLQCQRIPVDQERRGAAKQRQV